MRVIGGIYKGRTLLSFKGNDIRPTPDTVRESVFDILQFKIKDKTFFDLFCGTGAMGIEAVSRGAIAVFNDKSRDSVALTKKNLTKCGINAKVLNLSAETALGNFGEYFDFIYIDAPYKDESGLNALNNCAHALKDGGVVIFENEKSFSGKTNGLTKFDERKYGRVVLTFFKKGE